MDGEGEGRRDGDVEEVGVEVLFLCLPAALLLVGVADLCVTLLLTWLSVSWSCGCSWSPAVDAVDTEVAAEAEDAADAEDEVDTEDEDDADDDTGVAAVSALALLTCDASCFL